jgi:hypothetical protein|tara:strand:- start:1848 stop:2225 length:378 start_codon:yes stop_codon:yes gene_type:complete
MKDQNYIAKLEKAIADKYGDAAVQNPKANWNKDKEEEYLQELKKINEKHFAQEELQEKVEQEGVLLSKKLLMRSGNTSCPQCGKYDLTARDEIFVLRWECCETCHIKYVEGREERWRQGWRPNNG